MNNRSKTAPPARTRKPRRAVRLPLKVLALATVCALHALPSASHAQSIGALDVRSRLGEAFFAAVPVQTADGILDPHCIRVLPNPNAPEGAAALQAVRVRIGSADTVLIETAGTVATPVVGLRLEVGCEKPVARDFVVMDERPSPSERSAVAHADAPSSSRAAAMPGAATTRLVPAVRTQQATRRAPVTGATTAAARDLAPSARSPAPERTGAAPAAASASDVSSARRVAELRARSDDQAAALLALDDRLALLQRQAEAIKLQLAQRLGVVAPGGSTQPAETPAATAATPSTTSGSPSAPVTASVAPAPQFPVNGEATSSASTGGASAAPIATAAASTSPSGVVSPAAASPLAGPQHAPRSALDLLGDWKVAGGLAALLLGALAFKLRRRPTFKVASAAAAPERDWESVAEDLVREHARTQPIPAMAAATGSYLVDRTGGIDQTAEWIPPPTTDSLPVPSVLEGRLSALPGGAMSRESHLAQQFQPDAEHLVARASPEEIVQQARTHYMEDADLFKAIDLLEMAVAARKDSVRPWQALFAIYRQEKMPERFQRLANAYRKIFGTDESWSAILAFGRDIDPTNPLYVAQGENASLPEDLVERWLGVPLDFTTHLLANEMHDELMDTSASYNGRKPPMGG